MKTMSSYFIFLCFAIASAAFAEGENPYEQAIDRWESVLSKHVDTQGRINFIAVKESPDDLTTYVETISKISPSSHPEYFPSKEAVLAYHINTYNALAMQGVLDRDIPSGFTSFFKRASFFKFRGVVIGGKKSNLYDYENGVIRPFDEPRIHFALNCMVKDCPRLPQEAFRAETLDEQLEQVSIEFFNKEKHLRIDHDAKKVYVSGIMKFYTEDFVESGKKQDLLPYINQYRSVKIPNDYQVEYMKYDWRINSQ